jgi:tRNA dimethylallyltransferase
METRAGRERDEVLATLGGRKPVAVLIAGPTASGKSALAIAVAQALGGAVVNADSMQVYSDLRVLSARPDEADEKLIQHALYGFVPADTEFSVGRYLEALDQVLQVLNQERRAAVIVGGTGLYFRALTEGLAGTPAISPGAKAEVSRIGDAAALHAWLARHDPPVGERLGAADLPRLQRAAEVLVATGRSIMDWQRENGPPLLPPGSWAGFFLSRSREELSAAIDRRFESMIARGALEEAGQVAALALPANRGVMKAHGLPHLIRHLSGDIALPEAIRLGQQDTRRYAKRQMTWARRFMRDWTWIGEG